MLNNVVFVGKLAEIPTKKITVNGNEFLEVTINVRRPFKNAMGEYDSDKIKAHYWSKELMDFIASLPVGTIVAVKGRLQSNEYVTNDKVYLNYEVIGEKFSKISDN